jgi:hypothetical protein
MPIPYTREVEIAATGGEHICVTLPAPPRGTVKRFIIKQLDGVLAGYSYDLYDRGDCCYGEVEASVNPNDDAAKIDAELHKLQATQTVAGGTATKEQFALDLAYVNRDEQDPWQRRASTAIYLDLLPAGTGEKNFAVAYTIVIEND